MDPVDYIRSRVEDEADTYDIYRVDDSGPYNSDPSDTGNDGDIWVFSPTSSGQVVTEGTDQETSFTGLMVPQTDNNGNLKEVVEIGDELRLQSNSQRRYEVRTKDGLHDNVDPDLWQFGLERANAST